MHLSFLTSEYPHPKVNRAAGIGTSIKNLATSLVAKGISVSLFIYDQKEDAVFTEDGITFHLIRKKSYRYFGFYLYRKYLEKYINKQIEKDAIDVVEAPDWTGITAFMKLKTHKVIRLHGSDAYFCSLEKRPQKKKNFWFENSALKNADAVISVSDFTAKKTKEIFELHGPVTTIYNGIDCQKFKPLDVAVIPNSILYFGSIIRKKGVLDLARSFQLLKEKMPNAVITLIGNDNVDIFKKKSTFQLFLNCIDEAYKSSVVHRTHMPYDEVVKEIAKAAVIVLPSRAEAFPMTWLETMAMEKALISSNIGWANELMVQNETGLMVDPNDHQALADAILKVLNSKELATKFGKNARKRIVENFSSEIIVKKNLEFYQKLLQ
jgi:glycosyltransferase involved in cell wall biosynthesis